jgi:hypothetical protein
MIRALWTAALLIGSAQAQQPPVDVIKLDPHSHVGCTLASLGDPDPWGTCLVIGYKNVSATSIASIRFQVTFLTPTKEPSPPLFIEDSHKLKPGKTVVQLWHDGIYWRDYGGDKMEANVSVAKVMFADGTFWQAPTPPVQVSRDQIEAVTAGFEGSYPTIRVLSVSGTEAGIYVANPDRSLCGMFHQMRGSLRELGLTRVKISYSGGIFCEIDVTEH